MTTRILVLVLALVIAVALLATWRSSGSADPSTTGAEDTLGATAQGTEPDRGDRDAEPPVTLVTGEGPTRKVIQDNRAAASPEGEGDAHSAEAETEPAAEEPAPRFLVRGALNASEAFDGSLAAISFGRADGTGTGVTAPAFVDGTFELDATALVAGETDGPVRGPEFSVSADHPDFLPVSKSVWSRAKFATDSWTGDYVAYVELRIVPPECVLLGSAQVAGPARAALFEVDLDGPARTPVDETLVGSAYRLRARKTGEHILVLGGDELAPHSIRVDVRPGEMEVDRIVLDEGLCIGGLVELPGDYGAAGCLVECRPDELARGWPVKWNGLVWSKKTFVPELRVATVDEVGAFLVCGLSPGIQRLEVVGAPGGADGRAHRTIAEAGMRGLRITPPVALVRFFVSSENGPVSGARVTLRPNHRGTNTDADGNGEILVGARAWYKIAVTCAGYLPAELSMRAPLAGEEILKPIALEPREAGDASLVVRVKGANPPEELLVLWREGAESVPDLRVLRGDKGVFRLTGLAPGAAEFIARPADPRSYALDEAFTALLKAGDAKEVSLRFRMGGRLRLRAAGGVSRRTRYQLSQLGEETHLAAVRFLPCDETGPFGVPLEFPPEEPSESEYSTLPAERLMETVPSLPAGRYQLVFVTPPYGTRVFEIETGLTHELEVRFDGR